MAYYLNMTVNEVLIHTTWRTLGSLMSGGRSQKSHIVYNSIHVRCPEQADPEAKNRLVATRAQGKRNWE